MLHSFVPRPGLQFDSRAVELADEVLVLVQGEPVKEVARHAIAFAPAVAARTVLAFEVLVEASACYAHGIGQSLDEEPVLALAVVLAAAFRRELVGVGQLVVEDAACLIVEAEGIASGKAAFYPVCAVADAYVVAAAVLLADSVIVLYGVDDAFQARHVGVLGSPIECLQHAQRVLLNVGSGVGDNVVVDAGAFRLGSLVVELHVSGVILFPLLLHLDGSVVLGVLVLSLCHCAVGEGGSDDE